jgi:hypothetical protein
MDQNCFSSRLSHKKVAKETEHYVYVDISRKKIGREIQREKEHVRPLKTAVANDRQRPDILVWKKSSSKLRAVIEIKRAMEIGPVKRDADKIKAWLKRDHPATAGYILAFSEDHGDKRTEKLKGKFAKWTKDIRWRWVGSVMFSEPDDPNKLPAETWAWGIVLLCMKRESVEP